MKDLSKGDGIPAYAITEGATTPNPGYACVAWSTTLTKLLYWNGTYWVTPTEAKDVKSRVSSNTSGVYTKTYPAGYWINEPSINVNPISATTAGQINWKITKTLASGQWTVSITFTVTSSTVNVLALGVVNLTASPGTVTFDYQAMEPNP